MNARIFIHACLAASLLESACGGSDTTSEAASVTEGGEDLSMTAMAKKVPKVEKPAEKTVVEAPKPIVTKPVPKLASLAPEGDLSSGPSPWGAADSYTGAPLPKRPAMNANAAAAYRDGLAAL
ncbi:MAG TPA: hypothetical protein VGI70_02545, partial [Polyangiales bacterium]